MNIFHAAVLGLVEGITEFIPVSSTGHLILTADLLGFSGPGSSAFVVFIQLGAVLAVVVAFPQLFGGLFQRQENRATFGGRRAMKLIAVTTVPALVAGLLGYHFIKEHLFTPATVSAGLAAGGLWILLGDHRRKSTRSLETMNWRDALLIGVFQCLALWPGVSRAAATIMGTMALGFDRRSATRFSFFAAVPLLTAAAFYDLLETLPELHAANIPVFATGLIVSFLVAWPILKALIGFVGNHTLHVFGWYRLLLAAVVLYSCNC